ncbi:MAG: hypothetical protein ACD_45C00118G0008 [uncultured bacterium]|nr:MAG: hypothetical protein ACD_45C00118G0008 [uncultured bacterium]
MLSGYLVVGAFAGVMSGLFGVGGGVVVIPALAMFFLYDPMIPDALQMQMAIGTSLAIMITTSISALYAHHKRNAVRWNIFLQMLPGLIVGAIVGACVAHFVSSFFLKIIFSVFLFVIGIRLLFNLGVSESHSSVSLFVVRVASLVIGALSSLLGVGGGILIVPFLLHCQLNMREATGTSVACGLSVGIAATISFMMTGLFAMMHVKWSTGYIYWPAFFGIAVASTLFAPVGAALAHKLPIELLKRIFGFFLLLMAVDMAFSLI